MEANQPVGAGVIAAAWEGTFLAALAVGCLHAWLITTVRLPPSLPHWRRSWAAKRGANLIENVTEKLLHARNTQIQITDDQFRSLATMVRIPACLFVVLAFSDLGTAALDGHGPSLYALGGNEQRRG